MADYVNEMSYQLPPKTLYQINEDKVSEDWYCANIQ